MIEAKYDCNKPSTIMEENLLRRCRCVRIDTVGRYVLWTVVESQLSYKTAQ